MVLILNSFLQLFKLARTGKIGIKIPKTDIPAPQFPIGLLNDTAVLLLNFTTSHVKLGLPAYDFESTLPLNFRPAAILNPPQPAIDENSRKIRTLLNKFLNLFIFKFL